MKRSLAALLALAVAIVLYFVLRGGDGEPQAARGAADPGNTSPTNAATDLAAAEAASARGELVAEPSAAPLAAANEEPQPAASPTVDESQLARIRGVLLHHDGRPAVDAELVVQGWTANSDREQRYGLPAKKWEDVVASPNADGTFEVVFEAPRAFQFTLEASAPWAISLDWLWSELAPGSVTDLGTITMPSGGRIEGRVVLPDGTRAPGNWGVIARDVSSIGDRTRAENVAEGIVDSVTKEFVIAGVAPGRVAVEVRSDVAPLMKQDVTVEVGTTTQVVFVYDGPALDRTIWTYFTGHCFDAFGAPDMANVHLRAVQSGALVSGTHAERRGDRFVFQDIEPDTYVLVVADPRFVPGESKPIEAGGYGSFRLTGSVGLTFHVTRGGEPATEAQFEVQALSGPVPGWPPSKHHPEPSPSTGLGRHEFATTPDPQRWFVTAPGCTPHTLEFAVGFEPGSQQQIEVALDSARTISGRVVRSNGAPVVDAEVHVVAVGEAPPAVEDHVAWRHWQERRKSLEFSRAYTDADGKFASGHLIGDEFDVYTVHDPHVRAVKLNVPAGTSGLELRLEPSGTIAGRIDPVFDGCDGMRVQVEESARERMPDRFQPVALHWATCEVRTDGTFAMEDVPVGPVNLHVQMPPFVARTKSGMTITGGPSLEPIPVNVLPDTTTDVVVDLSGVPLLMARIRVDDVLKSGVPLQVFGSYHDAEHDHWSPRASGAVGADGLALLKPLTPGRWRFEVRSHEATWSLAIPGEHDVEANETLELDFAIELARGRVTLVDPSGVPLPNTALYFVHPNTRSSVTTDAAGALDLLLPAGEHTLVPVFDDRSGFGDSSSARLLKLVWTSDGPAEPLLVLPARD